MNFLKKLVTSVGLLTIALGSAHAQNKELVVGSSATYRPFAYESPTKEIVGYDGEIEFDSSKPDGTLRKLMDVSKINEMGWRYSIDVEEGIMKVYNEYKIKVANKLVS